MSTLEKELSRCSRVFVYGTLKRAFGNNRLMRRNNAEFLGETTTADSYVLTGRGCPYAHPVDVIPEEYHHLLHPIRGEVFTIPDLVTLQDLDWLEGHPDWYCREVIELEDHGPAWIYFNRMSVGNLCPVVEGAYQWPN